MKIKAGAAQVDISPVDSQFLYGYPHIERYSTGVHDPLLASALFLDDGEKKVLFIGSDILYVPKCNVVSARQRISEKTGIPAANIMITATHTHSGPKTIDVVCSEADPVVPKTDMRYVRLMEDGIVEAGINACKAAKPAVLGLAVADDTGVGTNRRDPDGPADHNVPVLMVKSADGGENIACMLVCSMHPTVLHEDSKLVSGDFPGLSRKYLQENVLGKDCVVVHHSGPCGNQSPRHVTKANTFEEAQRLGRILGGAVEKVLPGIEYSADLRLSVKQAFTDLPKRQFPSVEAAQEKLNKAITTLETLRRNNAPSKEVRTAECDWFGAEETLTLARAAAQGRLEQVYNETLPAEIQIISVGDWNFAAWPGEIFVDYALAVKDRADNTFVISLANGQLQGYIVTEQADKEGGYEASNSLFNYKSGQILVDKTLEILSK
jgi:neutral ceramidase